MTLVVVTDSNAGGDWISPDALAACVPAGVDAKQIAAATADLLFALSGYQYGTTVDTVRPARLGGGCGCGGNIAGFIPYAAFPWSSWRWWGCTCRGPSYVALHGPVVSVDEVTVDGATLDESAYRVLDSLFLVRTDGHWPCCQDLRLPSSEPDTFAVTYTHGPGVPAGGQLAAQALACALAQAAGSSPTGPLAGRIQTINRDGVSSVVLDNQRFLSEGMTGVTVADLWLSTIPNRSQSPSSGWGMPPLSGLVTEP